MFPIIHTIGHNARDTLTNLALFLIYVQIYLRVVPALPALGGNRTRTKEDRGESVRRGGETPKGSAHTHTLYLSIIQPHFL